MITIKELPPAYINQILELEKHSAPKLPTYYPYDKEELNNIITRMTELNRNTIFRYNSVNK